MFYRTAAAQQQTAAARQNVCSRLGFQLLATRPSVAQHHQLQAAAPSQWGSASRGAASLGLLRVGSLVAMSCIADEALAASYTTEEPVASASGFGVAAAVATQVPKESMGKPDSSANLVLTAGAFVLPHPDKMHKGGEDWYFIAKNRRAVGVADGVGGWAEVGVDAGAYARQLMRNAADVADAATRGNGDGGAESSEILERAYGLTTVRGSSTACVAVLNGDHLAVSNLGDSGLLILRAGAVAFHTPQQQHGFNFPYQIGSPDSMSDPPQSAQRFEIRVQPGDLILLGTDGLWDNCFDEELACVLRYCRDQSMDAPKMAEVVAHYARHRASDSKFASPFAYSAFQAGFAYMGGKMDDITVLICLVQQPAKM
ncbi:Serine/threonine phosphatase, family 2C [Volvox carteri f. nagariensis]|uniref:Protein phosphatase n=1 Tax=Volvox carteri f. nagariensis TaxID=3068 RepID=D8THL8_VOLCA|nr:Serine/threonine phosphatase, family 2C [Volvox carteri f. nagariensis]EFJ52734.1 Serine/threonine phosphatase, family 2C [Volvox carteri f. nagariensis]|eukprot:XP_002945739.1 Serine/threonine phosphatase, family 2C [Volvox carteri f. nagariensis]